MNRILLILFVLLPLSQDLVSQQFSEAASLTGVGQGSIAWGDYNNDGFADILISGWSESDAATFVYRNNGDGSFTEQTSILLPGVLISSVGWADLDNDNDLDILITGSTTGNTLDAISKVYRNNGATFAEVSSGLPGVYLSSSSFADFDRDGDIDILLTGMQTTGERISAIFSNNGNAVFTLLPGTAFTKICYGFASFGDYDNDGYPDVLISGQTASITRVSKLYHNNGDGTFSENTATLLHGMCYGSGSFADLNNDGYADILLTGEDFGFVTLTKVYINNKNGSFTEKTSSVPSGGRKSSVSCGDVDNDGDNDIVISGSRGINKISEIYANNGDAVFTLMSSETLAGTTESSVSLGDFDNDRDLDLLLTGLDQSGLPVSKVYRNNATAVNGKPGKPINLSYAIDKTSVTLSWDKVTGDETAFLSYNLRVGASAISNEYVSPQADGTGGRKIFSPGNSQLNTKFVLRKLRWNTAYYASVQAVDNSHAGGEFSDVINFTIAPQQPTKLVGSYVNPTSLLLRWKRGNGDRCIVFAREGTSGPSAPVNGTSYYANAAFGDGSPLGSTGWYCIYKGEADSVLLSALNPDKDYTVHAIELQGVNGSEFYATAVNPDNDNIGVFSSGIFTALSGSSMPGLRFSSVAWGDYDNDGYLDILLTGRLISGEDISKVFRNNGDNTFTEKTEIVLTGVENGSCAWGDYNNDDLLDIVITGSNTSMGPVSKIYRNNGGNSFTELTSVSLTGVTASSTLWTDYDNDGDVDLFLAGNTATNIPVSKIYRNNGNGSFTEQTGIQITGVREGSAAFGDYDNDGFPDLIITGLDAIGKNIARVYRNSGNNSFSEQTGIILQPVSFSNVAWGDYDSDGRLDILLAGATGYSPDFKPVTKIYHNDGNNIFTPVTSGLAGISNGSAEWGDYNNDGLLDILLIGDVGYNYEFRMYLNNGRNTFQQLTALNLPGAIACGSSSADYDMDGDLDILFSGYSGALLSQIYRNNLYMMAGRIKPNVRPEAPTGLATEVTPGTLRMTWAGVRTDETFYVNMSYNVRCRLENETLWKVAPQATAAGFRSLNDLGNAQLNRSFIIKNPASGKYLWQVQAVDQSFSGSEWSEVASVVIKNTQAYFIADTVCTGTTTTFTDQSAAADGLASWKWDFSDGTNSTTRNPVHIFAGAGNYSVKLVVSSTAGTKDSLVRTVVVKARPSVAFTAPNVCIGTPTDITNTTDLRGLTASAWSWKFGDGQTSPERDPGIHNFSLSGTFKASLKAVATNGCADSITRDIVVARYPEASLSVSGDFFTVEGKLTFCDGLSLQLSATSDTLYTYQWRKDGNDLTGATGASYQVTRNSGVYTARITNTLANCVSTSESKNINIKPSPTRPLIVSDNYKTGDCIGKNPVKIKVEQTVNEYSYSWLRNGSPINNATQPFIEDFLQQGDYIVTAALNGCKVNSEKFSVQYQGAPEKPFIYAQGPVRWYLACNNLNAAAYLWYYNGKLIDGAFKYYYAADQKLGIYHVRIGDAKGCFTTSDSLRIPLDKYSPGQKSFHNEDPFKGLKIYPNPSRGMFNIEMDNELYGDLNISIINQSGKEILKMRLDKSTIHFSGAIDLSGQTKGIYLVNMRMNDSFTTNQIIVE